MREFLRHARYGTVLLSEIKDILTPTQKNQKQRWEYRKIKKKYNFVNYIQQTIDQKNHTDTVITEHHLLKNEVDFELLWRYISKNLKNNSYSYLYEGNGSSKI